MGKSINIIILNVFFSGQLMAFFYGFQELSRMKKELFFLNEQLRIKTDQVVQLTNLIERHVSSPRVVTPTYNDLDILNSYLMISGITCVVILGVSFLVVVYYTPGFSLMGAVNAIGN
jgi:hypothetical protein